LGTSEAERVALDEGGLDVALSPYVKAIEDELRRHMDPTNKLMSLAYDFVGSGGKRLRPAVTLLFCESLSGSYKRALPIAAAYELAHAASLTQDDIIDSSATRHSAPTAHSLHGITTAILLSDMMLFEIFQRLADYSELDVSKEQLAALTGYIAKAAKEAAEGEYLEMQLSKKVDPTLEDYVKLAGLKTGALFGAAASSGAVVGGAKPRVVKDAYEYGRNLGIEFQVVDDVLDITGRTEEMGKPMLKDLQNDASNAVVIHALAHADPKTGGALRSSIARSAYGLADVDELLGIFDDLGSVEFASKLAKKHAALARSKLRYLPRGQPKETLERMTHWLETRRR
jgi:geranylgeranyl pyrophosphate synthase